MSQQYYLIKTQTETVGMVELPSNTTWWIQSIHSPHKGTPSLSEVSETEYSSFLALELFTVFVYNRRPCKKPRSDPSGLDFYDPNFYEVVKHRGENRIARRLDRRFRAGNP